MNDAIYKIAENITRDVLVEQYGDINASYFKNMSPFSAVVKKTYNTLISEIQKTNSRSKRKTYSDVLNNARCGDIWKMADDVFMLVNYVNTYLICATVVSFYNKARQNDNFFNHKTFYSKDGVHCGQAFMKYIIKSKGLLIEQWEDGKFPFADKNGFFKSEYTLNDVGERFSKNYIHQVLKKNNMINENY